MFSDTSFPVDELIPSLIDTFAANRNVVLQAPPGAGKTTRLPLALLHAPWLDNKKIIMLEPRRLAARSAAQFMAKTLGETVGETVGYRIRFDHKTSARTRIEVVTEGILARLLQHDPELADVGLVIFDEFHERSLYTDLTLALCSQAQQVLRDDLRLLVMSATLDAAPVARLLGDAPLLTSQGISYPVETRYMPTAHRLSGQDLRALPDQMVPLVHQALAEEHGNILVFLPGQAEIKAVSQRLLEQCAEDVIIAPLYGELANVDQEAALAMPPSGQRKVVLATSIAETSLTIPGIRVVIDSGWSRVPMFDPVSGMTRLQTVRASRASVDQRQGRAGRIEAGVCYRPWTQDQQRMLEAHTSPEIVQADLANLVLQLATWGIPYHQVATELVWLDPPPEAAVAQAADILQRLLAIDAHGRITEHGKALAELPMHPRLAHMILRAGALQIQGKTFGALACRLAALLSERDVLRREAADSVDVLLRLQALHTSSSAVHFATKQRVMQAAKQWQAQFQFSDYTPDDDHYAGLILAFAYPDRVAQRREASSIAGRFLLANGRGAQLAHSDYLAQKNYLVAAEVDGQVKEARIFLAAELALDDVERYAPELLSTSDRITWCDKQGAVLAQKERCIGQVVVRVEPLSVQAEQLQAGLCDGVRQMGLSVLPWTDDCQHFVRRVQFLHQHFAQDPLNPWPLLNDDYLLTHLNQWLAPFLVGMQRLSHLKTLDLLAALKNILSWEQQALLDELAPCVWQAPTGTTVVIDYRDEGPVIAVRIQEVFGQLDTPRIVKNTVPLRFHLLSPARRPIAVTDDLARFWQVGYPDVKKDMKGRYPKHPWPDEPWLYAPTRQTKKVLQ